MPIGIMIVQNKSLWVYNIIAYWSCVDEYQNCKAVCEGKFFYANIPYYHTWTYPLNDGDRTNLNKRPPKYYSR